MRFLLLCLSLLAGNAWGSCASGTDVYATLDNTLTSTCGNNMSQTGTVLYDSGNSPPSPNTYWAKCSSTYRPYNNSGAAMSATQGSVEFWFRTGSDVTSAQVICGSYATGTNSNRWAEFVMSGGAVTLYSFTLGTVGSFGAVSANTNYYFALNWDATSARGWKGTTVGNVTQQFAGSVLPTNPAIQGFALGFSPSLGGAPVTDGRFAQFRMSTVVRTGFPTSDGTPTPTPTNTPVYSPTPTPTATPTKTPTATPSATKTAIPSTPTPAATPALCGTPFAAVFTPIATPLIIASESYEQACVVEPNVILGPDGLFHMTYSANSFSDGGGHPSIALATSSSPTGPFTKYGQVVGGGHGGYAGNATMSFQLHIGSEYRIYFKDSNAHMSMATSTDGYNYTYYGEVLSSTVFAPYCTGGAGNDSAGIFEYNGAYWALIEVMSGSCPGGKPYVMWLGKSLDGGLTFSLASETEISSMTTGALAGKLYAGGRATIQASGSWYSFLHVDVPSNIYLTKSSDLFNWRTYPGVVIGYFTNMFGLTQCDQAADASVLEYGGNTYLYYDGTDNTNHAGRIGVAVFHGPMSSFGDCVVPTVTPTPPPAINMRYRDELMRRRRR